MEESSSDSSKSKSGVLDKNNHSEFSRAYEDDCYGEHCIQCNSCKL